MNDIVPELLELINQKFDERTAESQKLKTAVIHLRAKEATYVDANNFAIEVGNILSDIFKETIDVEILPDGRMYYNIADRILNPTMTKNYELITGYATDVQTSLNTKAGLHLKAQVPELNQDRIDGIINRISSEADFDVIKWILDEPIKNFSQSVVDDSIKSNADFQAKAGLQPKITRRQAGSCCDWCKKIVGVYEYPYVPEDVYRRHNYCRCTVTYEPQKGNSTMIHSGTEGKRRYVQDQYGGYKLSKEARVKRAKEMEKTEKARKDAARQKRIDTWAQKK